LLSLDGQQFLLVLFLASNKNRPETSLLFNSVCRGKRERLDHLSSRLRIPTNPMFKGL